MVPISENRGCTNPFPGQRETPAPQDTRDALDLSDEFATEILKLSAMADIFPFITFESVLADTPEGIRHIVLSCVDKLREINTAYRELAKTTQAATVVA